MRGKRKTRRSGEERLERGGRRRRRELPQKNSQ